MFLCLTRIAIFSDQGHIACSSSFVHFSTSNRGHIACSQLFAHFATSNRGYIACSQPFAHFATSNRGHIAYSSPFAHFSTSNRGYIACSPPFTHFPTPNRGYFAYSPPLFINRIFLLLYCRKLKGSLEPGVFSMFAIKKYASIPGRRQEHLRISIFVLVLISCGNPARIPRL